MLGKMKAKFLALSLIKKVVVILVAAFFSLSVMGALAGPPKIETKKVKVTEEVSYETTIEKDDAMKKGERKVKVAGKKGSKEVEYEITLTNDRETDRKKIAETIINKPENEVVLEGTREVTEDKKSETIPCGETTTYDSNLEKGKSEVRTQCVNGEKEIIYEVVRVEDKEVSRKVVKENVTKQPITEVTAIGTKVSVFIPTQPTYNQPPSSCDPNYSGACVPIASDVDCAGGSGNGPAYVWGPVYVIGYDKYDLDRDGNGVGCEN